MKLKPDKVFVNYSVDAENTEALKVANKVALDSAIKVLQEEAGNWSALALVGVREDNGDVFVTGFGEVSIVVPAMAAAAASFIESDDWKEVKP